MTINYTTLLGLTEPVTGTQSGTWGSDINTGLTDYVEAAIAGAQVISGSQTAVTLSVTTGSSSAPTTLSQAGSGATGSSQYQIIRCTGNPAGLLTITAPASDKTYVVINATSTSQSVKIVGAGPTTGVTIVSGERAFVAWNGSDFVKVGGAAGGTNTQVQYNNAGVFGGITNATTDGTTLSMTSPKVITGINDTNGAELLKVTATASAVNELTLANAAAGNAPTLSATGDDTNIGITLTPKGTGTLFTAGNVSFDGGAFVFNESGADKDFRIEGDTEPNLFFTDASTDRVGIGTGSPGGRLDVVSSSNAIGARIRARTGDDFGFLQFTNNAGSTEYAALSGSNGILAFYTGSSSIERMRLDSSGNLGIGTSSPTGRLNVSAADTGNVVGSGAATINITNSNEAAFGRTTNLTFSSGTGVAANTIAAISGVYTSFGTSRAGALAFSTDNGSGSFTERMRLDSSGNLGLGVTPSVWWSSFKAFQFGSVGSVYSGSGVTSVGHNTFYDGTNSKYLTTDNASIFTQTAGEFRFYTAPIGTANTAITFGDPKMTLDASGNLLVGTTTGFFSTSGRGLIEVNGSSEAMVVLKRNNSVTTDNSYIYATSSEFRIAQQAALPMTFYTSNTEKARITSGGDLLVGTSVAPIGSARATIAGATPSSTAEPYLVFIADTRAYNSTSPAAGSGLGFAFKYDVAGNYAGGTGIFGFKENTTAGDYAGALSFYTRANGGSGTERARITSGGNLLVGTTSTISSEQLNVTGSVADFFVRLINSNATPQGLVVKYSGATPNSTTAYAYYFEDSTAVRFYVRSNGGIGNYQANDANLSDRREKTNFAPAGEYLSKICAIPVQTFNYIDQNLEDDPGLTLGVVAQDVQAVAPELVMESNWAKEGEEPKMRLSIYQTDLQYALMKCIQEQQALITSLTARVAALEGTQP